MSIYSGNIFTACLHGLASFYKEHVSCFRVTFFLFWCLKSYFADENLKLKANRHLSVLVEVHI